MKPRRFSKIFQREVSKMCLNKTPYTSRTAAREAIQGLVSKSNPRRRQKNLHSYHCTNCNRWHISSKG